MEVKTFSAYKFPENCYAVFCGEEGFLVDPGELTDELNAFVEEKAKGIKYIFLTHTHFDHVGAVARVKELCDGALVVIHKADAEGGTDPFVSLSGYFGLEHHSFTPDICCSDGDEFKVGDFVVRVLHTPGHSTGSVCYMVQNAIFSGDTIFKGSYGRTDFPTGSESQLVSSLRLLKNLKGDYILYPGHGEATTLSTERRENPLMRNL